ncbi:hypothetical protein [Micromonospora sp. WMMD1082]|uniref:hypothetical protein n=1 Tax=Micromonospora sp. WMMD1082 TaxID=3016104 RepID=UPI0024173532|nr:hypothetical protein [Micromonospora sp. WMMD1082]MDG4795179.1 hypothetical protein [Micromonospora sp. WMMD1082]
MTYLTTLRRPLAALLSALMLTACQHTRAAGSDTASTPATTAPAGPPGAVTADGLTAPQRLLLLADTIGATPADTITGDSPYTYLHLGRGHASTDSTHPPQPPGAANR